MCGKCNNGLIEIRERHPYGNTYATETLWELCDDLSFGHCANCQAALVPTCEETGFVLGGEDCKACFNDNVKVDNPELELTECDFYNEDEPTFCPDCEKEWREVNK